MCTKQTKKKKLKNESLGVNVLLMLMLVCSTPLCFALLCSVMLCTMCCCCCCLLGAQSPTYQQMSSPLEVVWSTMIGCFICYFACTITIKHSQSCCVAQAGCWYTAISVTLTLRNVLVAQHDIWYVTHSGKCCAQY